MKRLRIAYVVPRCVTENSHGRIVLEMVRALGSDHAIDIFSSDFPQAGRLSATLHRVPLPDQPAPARLASWWAVSPLLVRTGRFDVVHTLGADAPVSTIVTAPCCNRAIRLAVESAGFGGAGLGPTRPAPVVRVLERLFEAADRFCMARSGVARVLALSRGLAADLRTLYGVRSEKIEVVPLGVDADQFAPSIRMARRDESRRRYGFAPDDFVWLHVGGAYRLKGLSVLLDVLERRPDPRLKLLTVSTPGRADLAAIQARGLGGRVVFTGFLRDVRDAYAAGDVFVHPTLYDGFSLSTLEAMASGLPVVVSRCAGVSELLKHDVDAVLLERPTDAADVGGVLDVARADGARREAMAHRGRLTAERHRWETTARQTAAIYAVVANGASSTPAPAAVQPSADGVPLR